MGERFRREALSGRVDEFNEVLAARFGRVRSEPCPARFELRHAGDDDVALTRAICDIGHGGLLRPREHHLILWAGGGDISYIASDGTAFTANERAVLLHAEESYTYRVEASRLTILAVSDRLLRKHLPEPCRTSALTLKFDRDDQHVELLEQLLRTASATIISESTTSSVRETTNALVAEQVLRAFPLHPPSGRAAQIAVAMEWMRAHAHDPITVAEVAAATGISVRTVQQDVSETPMQWVRRYRLEQVHDELQRAAAGTTVGSVARSWGFGHLGRFANEYAALFHEPPRTTLAHAAREA